MPGHKDQSGPETASDAGYDATPHGDRGSVRSTYWRFKEAIYFFYIPT
jgi:hypothetical protein